jgi:hypothetical protein
MSNVNRRKVVVCAAAVCELETPVDGSHRASPRGMLYSEHPEGSWHADDDFETQAFIKALGSVATEKG